MKPLSSYPVFTKFNKSLVDKIEIYRRELTLWNRKINLISRKEGETDYHFVDSACFADAIRNEEGNWVDVGSGGGFPGLAASILLPDFDFTLYEVIARKYAFLHHVKVACSAAAAIRNEAMKPDCGFQWDNAVCRALMSIPEWEALMGNNAKTLWFLASEDQAATAHHWEVKATWEIENHGTHFLLRKDN